MFRNGFSTTISGSSTTTFHDIDNSGGTLIGPSSGTINIEGDWDNGGAFTHNSSTVNFQGSGNTTIIGNTTFNNFSSTTAGKQINFTAGSSQTVNGSFSLAGTAGSEIVLRSTAANTTWNVTFPNGAQTVSEVDVQDSVAQLNSVTDTNGNDSGNNTNWIFTAARFWVGGAGNWNDTANWSTTSGGTGGASIPTSSELAIFDSNSGMGVTAIDAAGGNVSGVSILSGYGGVIDQGANSLTVGSSGFVMAGGTFTGGSGKY